MITKILSTTRVYFGIVCSFLFLGALSVRAQVDDRGGSPSPITSVRDIFSVVNKIVTWGYRLFFIAATFYILLAAYQYLTAKDNKDDVKKATASLKNAAIAIAIALVSSAASAIIKSIITPSR